MTPESGQTLSHYRLLEKIGEGGMGVVWKAEDTVLNRIVAIKVLPADVSRDEKRREMFLEEARLASSISDARIVQVHEFGHEGDLHFIVMEYVEGNPLNKILHGRPLPAHKVADYGHQVARALAKAHRKGLLHRDLKPGNILVTPEGEVKVVDFGLATLFTRRETALEMEATGSSQEETKNLRMEPTHQGRIAGTLPYMSPEQVRGERLDSRSDIFSLGTVLYEMTTGNQPFRGVTTVELAVEIQKARFTAVHDLVPRVPLDLDKSIQKALSAKPGERYQTMDDLAVDLARLSRDLESGSSASYEDLARPPVKRSQWVLVSAGVLLVVAVTALAVFLRPPGEKAAAQPAVHRQITFTGTTGGVDISPDGQFVTYVDGKEPMRLMVQDLGGGEPLEIFQGDILFSPRWSSTGTGVHVGWFTGEEQGFYLVPRLGGTARKTISINGSWSPDGSRSVSFRNLTRELVVFDMLSGERISAVPVEVDLVLLLGVEWSPSDDYFAFLATAEDGDSQIWTVPIEGGTQHLVVEETGTIMDLRWSGNGSAIYFYVTRGVRAPGDLNKVRIDPGTGEAAASPTTVESGLVIGNAFGSALDTWAVSRDQNRLVYSRMASDVDLWLITASEGVRSTRLDTEQLTSGTFTDISPNISPDGDQVAFVRGTDIFILSLLGDAKPRQLTHTEAEKWSPAWSPDGAWIAFGSNEGEDARVWRVRADGSTPRPFAGTKTKSGLDVLWHPGEQILYTRPNGRQFHLLDPDTEEEKPLIDDSIGWVFNPVFSPDGSRVVFYWNRRNEDYSLWTISLKDSSVRRIYGQSFPWGWSEDGAWVYIGVSNGLDMKVPSTGGEAESLFLRPVKEMVDLRFASCSLVADLTRWVCSVDESSSDIWLVENFDPDVN